MAYSFNYNRDTSISLTEFIKVLDEKFDPLNPESLIDCSEDFHKLSNNENLLVDFISEELQKANNSFQSSNNYKPHSFSLYACADYYIRANIWKPISNSQYRNWNKEIYKSLNTHDHNFYFLTVGYMGGGYTTEIWEYDYDKINFILNEKIELRYLEKTKLTKGKVMFYRASKDIHLQYPPKEYSISLNVIPNDKRLFRKEQLFFDVNSKTVSRISNNVGSGRHLITKLASLYGNKRTIDLLEIISKTHELPFIKLKSLEALSNLSEQPKLIWRDAVLDKCDIVSKNAKIKLKEYLN